MLEEKELNHRFYRNWPFCRLTKINSVFMFEREQVLSEAVIVGERHHSYLLLCLSRTVIVATVADKTSRHAKRVCQVRQAR